MPLEPASLCCYRYSASHPTPLRLKMAEANQIWVTPAEGAPCCHAKVYHGGGQNFCIFCCTAFIEQEESYMQNQFCMLVPPPSLIEAIWNWHLCHAQPPFDPCPEYAKICEINRIQPKRCDGSTVQGGIKGSVSSPQCPETTWLTMFNIV